MTKNSKDTKAIKSYKTKLSKKTTTELIDIILKKDNIERKNNKRIVALKTQLKEEIEASVVKDEQTMANGKRLQAELNKIKADRDTIKSDYRDYIEISNKRYNALCNKCKILSILFTILSITYIILTMF